MITEILSQFNTEAIGDVANQLPDWEDSFRLLGVKLINLNDFTELLLRLLINTVLIFTVVHFMYAKRSRRKDFYFSFMVIGVIVFLLCFLLSNVKLELGFALGLFAIFGILRYRTDAIPIKEMTYLFVVIGISVINALSNKKVSYAELMLTNMVIIAGLWYLEKRLAMKQELSVQLTYEHIENINLNKHDELLEDMTKRTGINISRFEINKIDFLRDVADITLYYNANNIKAKENEQA
ncbi:DUF4956 domain-containing protein [Carboxylicivirga sp. M1479]|uniref:DUF4956 domain-containing protein n=1 Tax=Carboxylicivirga sp. M1479 TaxID=2594476 RepID=UPI0011781107|nr:DUF4956 domain-containing protein [Carboxylicivirga sp. M1479]TRX71101.1 DUF4956 domain-containing protein [Carboxylicivirga sp. M1479]